MDKRRADVCNRIKTQLLLCNFGLPKNAEAIGLGKLSVTEARRRLRAIQELWVRLDLFEATGTTSKGTIDYPEAKRSICYTFNGHNPETSSVNLKALRKK